MGDGVGRRGVGGMVYVREELGGNDGEVYDLYTPNLLNCPLKNVHCWYGQSAG